MRVLSYLQFSIFIQTRVAVIVMRAIRVLTILPPHSMLLDMRRTCFFMTCYDGHPVPRSKCALDDNPQVCKGEKTGTESVSPALPLIVEEQETVVGQTSLKLNNRRVHEDAFEGSGEKENVIEKS